MTAIELELDCERTVEQLVTRHPATAAVLHRFGIRTGTTGTTSVREAAHESGVDPEALCAELHLIARPHWRARRLLARRSGLR